VTNVFAFFVFYFYLTVKLVKMVLPILYYFTETHQVYKSINKELLGRLWKSIFWCL